ncbi:tRNA 2-selenouridine(34) synthase MnmH [Tepidibacter hydrothermalis]|uniref:tRNA 2-selenouridine(34) synthase MnmH n=1 Tax=Tepidibacter hydrothermalis TaxID=3036126 RepID=A0ABY8EFL7_9FIRM|nr:tRNA 2-selenouridine(34) synthase MnmH [Tepidibacter hydrothermalis]WFD11733.1 tRNA 2-selenouridine(34) synthase MnmH [Tepidibacter hydrothermalis]
MSNIIEIENALGLENSIFIDVRSESEYEEDRILNSVNIPILNNEQRKIVGTLYKQEGKEKAIEKGLELIADKLKDIYIKLKKLSSEYDNLIVYCARGGMRSSLLVNFYSGLGINMHKLDGGYKKYRNYVIDFLEHADEDYEFIVLHGLTGVGKTDALKYLTSKNISSLDLEGLAQNCGSVFGYLGFEKEPPSQKMFETLLFDYIINSNSKYIFTESESRRIGYVMLPENIYNMTIEKGYHILIEDTTKNRIQRLVNQYVNLSSKDDEKISESIEKLRKRLGNKKTDYLNENLHLKQYDKIAEELIINYYDPLYKYSIDKFEYDNIISVDEFEKAMDNLINIHRQLHEGSLNKWVLK